MKLFTKTLLFFVGVIAFQLVLALVLVTNVTRRVDFSEAQRELEGEAAVLSDSFNSWKRQIWISLIGIRNSRGFARALSSSQGHLPDDALTGALRDLFVSKVDALVLADPGTHALDVVSVTYNTLDIADLRGLVNRKDQPYLELTVIRGVLCLLGVTRLPLLPGVERDVFLVKRMDADFCSQLTLNRRSQVALFLDGRYLAGSLLSEHPPAGLDPGTGAVAYRERYNEKGQNIALQWAGTVVPGGDGRNGGELYLGTFLSNEPYTERIVLVGRAVLLVSLAAALLTILLSLFLSRNITHPIADLLTAMERLKSGAFDTRLGGARRGYEIGRLFRGFDEMAHELAQDKREMQDHIRETVLLKEYNEKIVNSIPAGIAIIDRDLVVEKANSAFVDSFGLEGGAVVGAPLTWLDLDIIDEGLVEKIIGVLRGELPAYSQVKRSRSQKVFEIKLYPFRGPEGPGGEGVGAGGTAGAGGAAAGGGTGAVSGCVFLAEDVSVRTELEHKIFQAEKLSSISMLSAGMAHEINNPLGSILTNVQNLIAEEAVAERAVSLRWIEQETRRIARIVRELLRFSSSGESAEAGADVNEVVRDVIRLVGHSLAPEGRIRVDSRLAEGLPCTVLSPDELKQVVINLVTNSVQAIEGPGRILVSTRWSPARGRISLSVADSGSGIPEGLVPRIFDPFFTTKANGVGTGLGLSVVYGIVTKYDGGVEVRSRPGAGTRIVLGLPAREGART
jgi:signal transduction histidine kinase